MNMKKVNEAINDSIVTALRQTVTVKAPDIYAVTKLIGSDNVMATRNGLGWDVDGELDDGYEIKLHVIVDRDYSEYTVRVSTEASYYGSSCTDEDAEDIAIRICNQTEREFPNLVTELWSEGDGSCSTTGPNEDTCQEIDDWMQDNWTAAL